MMSRNDKARRRGLALVAEIDEAELGVRLMEVAIGLKRPKTDTRRPEEILRDARANMPDGCEFQFGRMASVAIEYFNECIKKAQSTQ